ncbi:glutamate racemase [Caldalkalibacillus thermarum]|uniref:glutamate racemase n=1 Tax=Caldalkalibacillus thermarum TaxID=296745 RepID=UPI0023EEE1A8|nr:glutamate racemase [Caldalkalibacillus thermarum]
MRQQRNIWEKEAIVLNKPIAVIDSGVGGLTVVQELLRQLPREEIVYFGDTARCPYGPRPQEEVRRFSYQMLDFLDQFEPKMIVIACNTATAVILEELQQINDKPVVGVIHPGVRAAIKATVLGRIGVIGTQGTIASGLYEKALKQIHPHLYVKSLACPDFVPLVEQGEYQTGKAYEIVRRSLLPLLDENLDTLVLGCTHYPILAPVIQDVMGEDVKLISSADETAREVSTLLFHKNMLSQKFERPEHLFFTSGDAEQFKRIAEAWLDMPVNVSQVSLAKQV